MFDTIRDLYDELKKLPFPELGKVIGDFPLYDSLLAGTANSILKKKRISIEAIPAPDSETEQKFKSLKQKADLDPAEQEFVAYFNLLENLRHEMIHACARRNPKRQKSGT